MYCYFSRHSEVRFTRFLRLFYSAILVYFNANPREGYRYNCHIYKWQYYYGM